MTSGNIAVMLRRRDCLTPTAPFGYHFTHDIDRKGGVVYVHPAFTMETEEAFTFLATRGFGTLMVASGAVPLAVHVPFLASMRSSGTLHVELHVARANPIHTHIGEGCPALLTCQGPDAYISPDWYGSSNQVPTWTYVAVHLTGIARLLPETELLSHADRLSAVFEERLRPKTPWTSKKMDEAKRSAMLRAIVGITLDVERVEAQKKLSQHKSQTDLEGAMQGLLARNDASSTGIANLMQVELQRKLARG